MINKGFDERFTEELKTKCDIVSTISKYITLQKKGKTYWACCPFHYEKTPSFAVNEVEQYYHCFGCGESGDVIKFVSKFENVSFIESVKILADSCGMKLPEYEQNEKEITALRQKEKALKALNLARDYYKANLQSSLAKQANEYLQKRELNSDVVNYFNIGVSLDWNSIITHLKSNGVSLETMKLAGLVENNESGNPYDVFGKRLMFPIENMYGDCIGFTARSLDNNTKFAKYKNSSQTIVFDKSRTIYNIKTIKELKKEAPLNYIIICEGTIDVIAMYKSGFKNTVACLGTAITPYHAKELKKYTDKVILCLDGDDAGQNAIYKAIDVLAEVGLEVRAVKLKENLDPDEYLKKYGKEELANQINASLDAYEFKILNLAGKYNLADTFEKNKFIKESLEIINKFETSSEKEIYLKILAKIVNMPIDILRRDVVSYNGITQSITEEEVALSSRQDGLTKAIEFVLACLVHKKEFAISKLNSINIKFKNSSYLNVFNFVKDCINQNKTFTISTLFDYFNVDEDEVLKRIINFNFSNLTNEEDYFNNCLNKILLLDLEEKQKQLTEQFKKETDLTKRRDIIKELGEVTKEIKNKQRGQA